MLLYMGCHSDIGLSSVSLITQLTFHALFNLIIFWVNALLIYMNSD